MIPSSTRTASPATPEPRLPQPAAAVDDLLLGMFEAVPDALLAVDSNARIVLVNGRTEELFGHPREDLVGQSLAVLVPERLRAGQDTHLAAYLASPRPRFMDRSRELVGLRRDGSEFPADISLCPFTTAAGTLVIAAIRDMTERRRAEGIQRFLAEAGQALASSLDYETTLQTVARLALGSLADLCIVDLLEDEDHVRRVAVADANPAREQWADELHGRYLLPVGAELGVPAVLRTGQPELLAEIALDARLDVLFPLIALPGTLDPLAVLREMRPRSRIIVPLHTRGRTLGSVMLIAVGSRRYAPADLTVAEELARRAAMAVDNARLYAAEQRARQVAEQAVREWEAERDRLQQIVDLLPEAVVIADARTRRFASCNAASVRLLGRDISGQEVPFGDAPAAGARRLDGTPLPASAWPLQRSLVSGEAVAGEQMLIRPPATGRTIPVLANSTALRDASGQVVGAVVVFQDIQALLDLQRHKDALLRLVSHDLRNALTIVRGHTELVRRRATSTPESDPADLASGLAAADAWTERAIVMVEELVDVVALQEGRPLRLRGEPTDLVAVVRQIADEASADPNAPLVRVESPDGPLVGQWDRRRLERVFANLLSNAIKYSPDGGEVAVVVRRQREGGVAWAVLEMRDQGLGIPEADVPHVFEWFYRATNVEAQLPGSGLGLAGVQRIVEQHGGRVDVASVEGQGSTFTCWLPLDAD